MARPVNSPNLVEPGTSVAARRFLRTGWLLLALLPAALTTAAFLGSGLLAGLGWYAGLDLDMPLRVALRAGAPTLAVLVIPSVAAAWCGRRAERLGHPGGRDLYIVAAVVSAVSVVLNVALLLTI